MVKKNSFGGRAAAAAKRRGKEKTPQSFAGCGADEQIRTAYLFITNEVLYRLSYISI